MRSLFSCFFITILMFACQNGPEGISGVDPADLWVDSPRLAKFNNDDGIAVVFVDAQADLVSIHTLSPELDIKKLDCLHCFTELEDSVEAENLWNLVNSNEHYVYVLDASACDCETKARLGVCCCVLQETELTYTGTGFIELSDFPWLDIEQEFSEPPDDDFDLPKASSTFIIAGFGKIHKVGVADEIDYEANCNMTFKYADKFEEGHKVDIKGPNGL